MARIGDKKISRVTSRAVEIAKKSTNPKIKLSAKPLQNGAAEFKRTNKLVRRLTRKAKKELVERDTAVDALATEYDQTRSAILVQLPSADVDDRASSQATPDDLINAAMELEDLLINVGGVDEAHPLGGEGDAAPTGEEWARALIPDLSAALSAAIKENSEAVEASSELQDAIKARIVARSTLKALLRSFRQLVRDVYGPSSNAYRSIRLLSRKKSGQKDEIDQEEIEEEDLEEDEDLEEEEEEIEEHEEPEEPEDTEEPV